MTVIIYKEDPNYIDRMPSPAYRHCVQYAAKNQLLVTHYFSYIEENKELVLLHVAQLMARAQGTPNDLIVYELDDIRVAENRDLFLPLIVAKLVTLHVVQSALQFSHDSPPEHLELGAFKKIEEQALCAYFLIIMIKA